MEAEEVLHGGKLRGHGFVERLNEHSLEDCLGRQRATAIYIVGGWVLSVYSRGLGFVMVSTSLWVIPITG